MMPDVLMTPPGPSPPPSPATSRVSHGSRYVPERTGRLARRACRRAGSRRGPGDARRADDPSGQDQADDLRRWLDALGLARAGRRPGRAYDPAGLSRRSPDGPGLVEVGVYSMTEVLAPTMIDFAPPELAATMVPRLLRGDEMWCQGFSEPGTGSNLGWAVVPGHSHRRRLAGQRPEGVDELRPILEALRAAHPDRYARVCPPGHHRTVHRHGQPRNHGPPIADHARSRRNSPRCSTTT